MKAYCSRGWLLGLGLAMAAPLAPAAEPDAAVRAAAARGLGFIARAGDQWVEDKNCNSCHHLPQMLWSHREAKRRGFVIDQAQYDAWLAWAAPKTKDIRAGREEVAFMTLALPGAATAEAEKIMLEGLPKDGNGTWMPAGQFTLQRREAGESQLNSTRLFLMALAGSQTGRKAAEEARTRAAEWMDEQAAKPAASIETVAFQALYAQRFGLPKELEGAVAELLQRQREDGGWSWMTGDPQSDALGTGQALYALLQMRRAEDAGVREAITRAQQWLIRTQAPDGSWAVKVTFFSKNARDTPDKAKSLKQATEIYTCWATAWGTQGLLQSVPVEDAAAQ